MPKPITFSDLEMIVLGVKNDTQLLMEHAALGER